MEFVGLRLAPREGAFMAVDDRIADCEEVTRELLLDLDWLSDESSLVLYKLEGNHEDIASALARHDGVRSYDVTVAEEGGFYLFVHAEPSEPLSQLLAIVDRHALLVKKPIRFVEDGVFVTVAGRTTALKEAFGEIPDSVRARVERIGEFAPERAGPLDALTPRQREALEAAYALGYYETPRQATCEAVAAELDCSSSTANELLRRAETTVIARILERGPRAAPFPEDD